MIPLFDLGNVVVQLNFRPFEAWIAERTGCDPGNVIERLGHSSLWFDYELGNISKHEFVYRVGKIYGTTLSPDEFERHFCSIFPGLVPGVADLLGWASARGPVYCLTNTNKMHYDFLTREFPEVRKFTRVFASHEIQMRKPWPGTYISVARWLGVPSQEVVFFDDVEANVMGARAAGIAAHLFRNAAQAKEILEDKI